MNSTQEDFEHKLQRVLVSRIAGCSKLVSADRLSGGAAQETYKLVVEVDGHEKPLAFRRANGGEFVSPTSSRPGLAAEARLMECAKAAGVPEPAVYYVLERDDDLGDGFLMEWLEGEALGARIVRSDLYADIRPELAYEFGKILAKIHRIDLDESGLRDKLAVISPDEFIDQMWDQYKDLKTPQPMIDYTARWLKDHLPANPRTALVHNEFRNGNVMISPERVVAVLDWEAAHIGDPMRDLGWLCTNSWRFGSDKPVGGFGDYEDLFRGYEEIGGEAVNPDDVKFWEVFGSYWWAVISLDFVLPFRTGLDTSVERAAVGRRTSESQIDCVNLLIPGPVEVIEPLDESSSLDMPRADELLTSIRDFLRADVMTETTGRTNFFARVGGNSVDIVIRELARGVANRNSELTRLAELYGASISIGDSETLQPDSENLRWRLVNDLRDGSMQLDNELLKTHLRTTVANQILIDQPKYNGLKKALGN